MNSIADRRTGLRAQRLFRVAFLLDGVDFQATVTDISRAGAFLHCRQLPRIGTTVDFAVKPVKEDATTVMVTGEVVRVVAERTAPGEIRGFGVKWRSMRSSGGPSAVADLFFDICGEPLDQEIPRTREPTSVEYSFDEGAFMDRDVTKPDFRIDNSALDQMLDDSNHETIESPLELYDVRLPALVVYRETHLNGMVRRLGAQNLVLQTPLEALPVASMVTIRVTPPSGSWSEMLGIHMLGRVVSSRPEGSGGESEIRLTMVDERGVLGAFELLLDDAREDRLV